MSELLDELARSLTTAMPRRRAVRVLGGALLGMALPAARASGARATHDCPSQNAFLCKCPSINGLFFRICCPNETASAKYKCTCKAPPNGYAECTRVPTNRCLQAGSVTCGNNCCKEGEKCVNPKRGLCCKADEAPCAILPVPGSGQKADVQKCCDVKEICCANDKRSTCCAATDGCCAGRCCPPAKECDKKTGTCSCPKGTETCGRDCCKGGKNPEKCCDDHCCKSTEVCCGNGCCDKDRQCCGGDCCTSDQICVTTSQRDLQGSTSPSTPAVIRRICCPKPRAIGKTRCCPAGTVAGTDGVKPTCCPPRNPDCCDPPCLPGTICVNGTCKKSL